MSATLIPHQQALLTSWKEIASYLGKGVRTVQRWEQQFGLPVRRPNEKIKGIVHATTRELDQWLAEEWKHRPRELLIREGLLTDDPVSSVRSSIEQSAQLRASNRLLLANMRNSLHDIVEECRILTRSVRPPQ